MLIKKLKLHNIRSYTDAEISFPQGSVLLSGDIGSGKSTILLAIEFALFGVDSDRLSGAGLLRQGTSNGSVELEFEVSGKNVTIFRGLKKNKDAIAQTAGAIIIDGVRKEAMPVELKAEVINLLGYPEELATKKRNLIYRYTIYCPQEEMKSILSDDAEARIDTLRKIFGVEKYKRVRENCAVTVRELKSMQQVIEARTEGFEMLKMELAVQEENRVRINLEVGTLLPAIKQIGDEIVGLKENMAFAEKQRAALQENRRFFSIIEAKHKLKLELKERNAVRIVSLKTKLSDGTALKNTDELQEEITGREEEINSVIMQQRALQQKLYDVRERLKEVLIGTAAADVASLERKRMAVLEMRKIVEPKEMMQRRKTELENLIKHLRASVQEYSIKKNNADEIKHKILELAQCPTCLQEVSKEHKEQVRWHELETIELCNKKIVEYDGELKRADDEWTKLTEQLDNIFEAEKGLASAAAELKHIEEKQVSFEQKKVLEKQLKEQEIAAANGLKQYEKFNAEIERAAVALLKKELEKLRERERNEKELSEMLAQNDILSSEINALENEKVQLAGMIESLKDAESVFKQVIAEQDELRVRERELLIKKASLKAELDGIGFNIAKLMKDIEAMEKNRKKLAEISALRNWLEEYFINLMVTIEKHVMAKIYHEFNELFAGWFGVLIADEGMSARVDDSFAPVIEQNGYEVDVSYLSGGERTSAALAYRLALTKVVNDVVHTINTKGLLVLDEPTDGFSSEQLDRVREVLDQLAVKQVIIVSHEGKIESFVENVVKVVKEDGVSRVLN